MTRSRVGRVFTACIGVYVAVAACSVPRDQAPERSPAEPPVDVERIRLGDVEQWAHRRTVDADLDGNGSRERIILTADVVVRDDGTPLWEDGHRWAVLVEDAGERTLLYGAFVPNGLAEAAVLMPDADGRRNVLVLERTPQRSRTLVIAYDGPGAARTVSAAEHHVDEWLPSLALP